MDVLLPTGWYRCGRGLRGHLNRQRQRSLSEEEVERRRRRACNSIPANATVASPSLGKRLRLRSFVWRLSPPLGYGAPRSVPRSKDARAAFVERLGEHVSTELLEDARAGLDGARARRTRVEQRAGFFLGAAGATGTLVLANAAIVAGKDKGISTDTRQAVLVALTVASLALVISGLYALFAVMRTFGNIAARANFRILERSHLDEDEARRAAVGALLAAQFRMGHIADWKLARLKRATTAFLVAMGGVFVASSLLLASAIH